MLDEKTVRNMEMTNKGFLQNDWIMYADSSDGSSIMWLGSGVHDGLAIRRGWKMLGASYKDALSATTGIWYFSQSDGHDLPGLHPTQMCYWARSFPPCLDV